jgi:hypothetical protein
MARQRKERGLQAASTGVVQEPLLLAQPETA